MTQWPGWSERDTLILPIDGPPPSARVELAGRRFDPKGELHVTLVGAALGAEMRRAFGRRLDAATRPAFEALDWRVERTGHAALVEKTGDRDDGQRGPVASVIEFVDLPALAHFHGWLGGLLGRQLPCPPPHVTLYTHGRAQGIGIPTKARLRAWTRATFELHSLRAD